ncbi:TniQ family protein [Pseudomonas sp. QE6]|uniref:TniQ family protein n=1 Tax=Pseudomonas sp. QE6 TaxID=3242491 RepID=UPI0035271313
MFLNIQKDESFDSFLSRNNLFLGRCSDEASAFVKAKNTVGNKWVYSVVEEFSGLLGGRDLSVIEMILQNHTLRPAHETFVDCRFKFSRGFAQGDENISSYIRSQGIGICILCAEDDMDSKGFTYWRRSHQTDANVCPLHNVRINRNCHACGKAFSLNGLYSQFLWEGCDCGASPMAGECCLNEDWHSLQVARFYCAVLNQSKCFDAQEALSKVVCRLESVELDSLGVGLFNSLDGIAHYKDSSKWWINIDYYRNMAACGSFVSTNDIVRLAAVAYRECDEFVSECTSVTSFSRESPRDRLLLGA